MDAVRQVLAHHLPRWAGGTITALGSGQEHTAYEVDGTLVVRFGEPGSAAGEARVLAFVADIVGELVPVPQPVLADDGVLAYPKLAGTPLSELEPPYPETIAATLREVLDALHAVPAERVSGLVGVDADPLAVWHEEATALYPPVAAHLPAGVRAPVEAFLAAAPPADPGARVFSHNDLGIEHVLVDPATDAITGVIDWSDAALCDPAYDLGLLWRDLGVLPGDAALRERARFYACCTVLEDLEYGLRTGRERYVARSLYEIGRIFG